VLSSHGRGQTLLLGSYVSAAHQSLPTPEGERFFAGLLAWAGVTPSLTVSGAEIEARALESGDDTLLFLFNHDTQRAEARVSLALPERARAAVDLVTGRMVALHRTAAGGELIVALEPKAVQVVRIGSREHVIAPAQ